jgi:hypothetical protein
MVYNSKNLFPFRKLRTFPRAWIVWPWDDQRSDWAGWEATKQWQFSRHFDAQAAISAGNVGRYCAVAAIFQILQVIPASQHTANGIVAARQSHAGGTIFASRPDSR